MRIKASTIYCYHCRTAHPREDMKLVVSKSGKRWRCAQSIAAAQVSAAEREAFGRKVSEENKNQQRAKLAAGKVVVDKL